MVSRGETYQLKLFKRKKNTAYEYEQAPLLTFRGRPAKPVERSIYTIQAGIASGTDDTYVFCTELPVEVSEGDRVEFLGKMWSVSSVGVYFDEGRYVNAGIMDSDKLLAKCPKGLTLK